MTIRAIFATLHLAGCIAVGQTQGSPSSLSQLRNEPSRNVVGGPFIVVHADVPLYPAVAKAARLSGTVNVRVSVKGGSVASTDAQSSDSPILVNASKENIRTWRFAPDAYGTFEVTFIYELQKEESLAPENPRVEMRLPSLVRITARPTKAIPFDGK